MGWLDEVVPYIGTWIETFPYAAYRLPPCVVPYIGTWIETDVENLKRHNIMSYLI